MRLTLSGFGDIENDLSDFKDGKTHSVKLSTTKIVIERDRRDSSRINSINNMKIVYKNKEGGVYILLGNLQCNYRPPYGGMFFCKKIIADTTDFVSIKGIEEDICFIPIGDPISNQQLQSIMQKYVDDSDFEFNIGQFDEFMELFEFYKSLSDEINNNVTYQVNSISKPYYFIHTGVKNFSDEYIESEVKDVNGVLKGYTISETDYVYLPNEIKDQVDELIDVYISGGFDEIAKIRRVGYDNIYLSNSDRINEKNVREIKQFSILNMRIDKKELVLSGNLKKFIDMEERYEYLNLYDMGQKIKIESIDNSLRLINKGATGAATELLEYLIGDERMPNRARYMTDKKLKVMEPYMKGLNESQRQAFVMAVDGSPVSLIKGPPGTGKTHVINAIVQYITKELDEKVIVSSQTHIAIDNVLDKLMENYDLIIPNRITNKRNKYSNEYIDDTLYRTWGNNFTKHNIESSNKELANKMQKLMDKFKGDKRFCYSLENNSNDYSVIGATTTTSAIAGKKGLEVLKGYNWLIIDEVSKCPITEVLRYLPYVEKIIMVGDDFQLAPLLEFSKDDVKNLKSYNDDMFEKLQAMYEQSVFSKVLDKAIKYKRLVVLNENYRSVHDVLETYNVFYSGTLIGKREEINPRKVHFLKEDVLDYDSNDVFFIEVFGGQEVKDGTSRFNTEEINATAFILEDLMKKTINPENVTVSAIFPYAAQINHFQKGNTELINKAKKHFKSFEIDTVDAFQGKETDIVLVNTVVTDQSQRNFLNDFRRINVSMSRAKDKLIIFGNSFTLGNIKMKINGGDERKYFKEIVDYIKAKGKIIHYKGGVVENGNKSESRFKLG